MLDHEALYQKLLIDLRPWNESHHCCLEQVQHCFSLSYLALRKLDEHKGELNCENSEELFFLRHIRPQFIREVHYYEMVYFAALFVPEEKTEALPFWRRECERLKRFEKQYPDFCAYFRSGRTDEDERYYKTMEYESFHLKMYADTEERPVKGDELTGQLLALERYCSYVLRQVIVLMMEAN